MDDLMLAYSISIHKSQGSEFPVVIIPATMSQYMMLQRNLFYTGVTRGKKLVILVGEEKAIQTAVRTSTLKSRNTALAERLGG
jgi:exodeoxyribonuclease V alpha subunit